MSKLSFLDLLQNVFYATKLDQEQNSIISWREKTYLRQKKNFTMTTFSNVLFLGGIMELIEIFLRAFTRKHVTYRYTLNPFSRMDFQITGGN